MANRRFAPISAYEGRVTLPARQTAHSAGYDLAAAEEVRIPPGGVALVPTGLKAYMGEGEVLILAIRSSLGMKRNLSLANSIGVIDADYVDNPDNEGHIRVGLRNFGHEEAVIAAGERVAQAIFVPFLITSDDAATGQRTGGIGSTGR